MPFIGVHSRFIGLASSVVLPVLLKVRKCHHKNPVAKAEVASSRSGNGLTSTS